MKTAPRCHKCSGPCYLVTDKIPGHPIYAQFHCYQCGYDDVPLGRVDLIQLGMRPDVAAWLLQRRERSVHVWDDGIPVQMEAGDADVA